MTPLHSIFISYRRDDTADVSGRVFDRLCQTFGRQAVFKDVDNLPMGRDFGAHIRTILPKCKVFLAMIGPGWAEIRDESGARRLDSPEDWVRIELEIALRTEGLQVIPVLVNAAAMPKADQLPGSLHGLLRLNAAVVRRDPDFHTDMDRLIRALEAGARSGKVVVGARPWRTRRYLIGAAAAASAALGAWLLWPRGGVDQDEYLPLADGFYLVAEDGAEDAVQLPSIAPDAPPLRIAREPVAPAGSIARARVVHEIDGRPAVLVELTERGVNLISDATASNINRRMALVVNGVVIFDAVIREPIEDGRVQVSGAFSASEANAIARRLSRQANSD